MAKFRMFSYDSYQLVESLVFIKKIMFITVMIGWVPLHTLTYKIGQEPGIAMIGGSDSNVYHVIKADISSCSII